MQQFFRGGVVHLVARDELDAGVDALFHWKAFDVRDERFHAQIAHLHGVLQDEGVDVSVGQAFHQRVGRVEANELHLAGPAAVFEHAQHAERR